MTICIVGRDSVALMYAAEIVAKAAPVTVCGYTRDLLEIIAAGGCPFPEEPGLASRLEKVKAAGTLRTSCDLPAAAAEAELVMIFESVEMGQDRGPDYSRLEGIIAEVAQGLTPGKIVLFNGMIRVGDTCGRLGPLLEQGSGLRLGRDFAIAYSTERGRPGHALADISITPKIVAASDEATGKKLVQFFQIVLETVVGRAHSIETAEYAHLAEAAVRDVNAALAIELAQRAQAHGIDLREAFALAESQSHFPVRMPGLDGDGAKVANAAALFLDRDASTVDPSAGSLLALGRRINESVAPRAVARLEEALGSLQGKEVALMVDEVDPEGPVPGSSLMGLMTALQEAGALARIVDPACKEGREKVEVIIHLGWHTPFAALELSTYPRCRHLLDATSMLGRRRVEAAGLIHLAVV